MSHLRETERNFPRTKSRPRHALRPLHCYPPPLLLPSKPPAARKTEEATPHEASPSELIPGAISEAGYYGARVRMKAALKAGPGDLHEVGEQTGPTPQARLALLGTLPAEARLAKEDYRPTCQPLVIGVLLRDSNPKRRVNSEHSGFSSSSVNPNEFHGLGVREEAGSGILLD